MQKSIGDKLTKLQHEKQSIDEEIHRLEPELRKVWFLTLLHVPLFVLSFKIKIK